MSRAATNPSSARPELIANLIEALPGFRMWAEYQASGAECAKPHCRRAWRSPKSLKSLPPTGLPPRRPWIQSSVAVSHARSVFDSPCTEATRPICLPICFPAHFTYFSSTFYGNEMGYKWPKSEPWDMLAQLFPGFAGKAGGWNICLKRGEGDVLSAELSNPEDISPHALVLRRMLTMVRSGGSPPASSLTLLEIHAGALGNSQL